MNTRGIFEVVVLIGLTRLASTSPAAEGTWTGKADMATGRLLPSTCVVEGKIYAIGGGRGISGPYLSTVEVYDPATDTWTPRASMHTARNGHAAAVVNGKIYVIGGEPSPQASLATVEEYDPATDTWTRRADMPTKRTFLCACEVDGKIYAFGGVTAGVPGADWNPSALEVYDPSTDTWATRSSMLMPTCMAGACAVNGKIYAMGGVPGGLLHDPAISTVEVYDPATDTWTMKPNMPTARSGLSLGVVGGRIYAIGGGTYGGPTYSTVEEYDPAADSWTTMPDMPTARLGFSTAVVNSRIYAIGGARDWYPASGMSTVEEYDLTGPPPDFNGDGSVDGRDVLILAEHWGQDDSICDIAPVPFGDGTVDVQDLIVLADSIGKEVSDPTLMAHWKLDEAEGITACDSAGYCDATLCGNALWQPDGGAVDGALDLDGIDDFLATDFVFDPAEGPFSVLAWVKGGAPGQAALSQIDGEDWLGVDPTGGFLMTALRGTGRDSRVLHSEAVVTDGDWHRIGLTWDGTNRCLHVDDSVVAEDTQAGGLGSCSGTMNIGCGRDMATGAFWGGLIDDVRIYSRTVRP